MYNRFIVTILLCLLCSVQSFAEDGTGLQIRAGRPGANVTVEREIDDSKALISVSDTANNPMFGLSSSDFVVSARGRNARIISVQPLSESLEVPRNIVLVLDNSDSMRQRNAIEPLKDGVDELLKIVRPIDKVQIVTFGDKGKTSLGGRDLRVQTFTSNHLAGLKNFVAEAYGDGITARTMLYDAMLVGLELIRTMPPDEPRFMVVFSDGEDLNSTYKENDVFKAEEGLARFNAYAIDYMPGSAIDPFLTKFVEGNHGEVWKATSETNLVPIFQSVASKMQYYYVVSYLFPTTGSLGVAPASLTIDDIEVPDVSKAGTGAAKGVSIGSRIDASSLLLHPAVDTAYGIAGWKLKAANSAGTLTEQSGDGAPAAEIKIPIKTDDLRKLAEGGDITVSMEVKDSKGQTVLLTAQPVKVNYFRTTGNLAADPASLIIEEIKTIDSSPMLGHVYFADGSSEIPAHYVRLADTSETAAFNEQRFRDTLEKYYQVLNIVGKRLTDHPEATITLTGCNANTGTEKGKKKLSMARAEAVRDYLQTVWAIVPERIKTEARNLPEVPSTSRLEEGKAENRRVEIRSEDLAILAPVRSTYFTTRIDTTTLTLRPSVNAAHGVAHWSVSASNSSGSLGELSGEGEPPSEIRLPLNTGNLNEMAAAGDITVRMAVKDRKGQELPLSAGPVKVNFIQTSQRLAQKQDFRVQEKYALILFDFDSDAISAGNREIVNAIVARLRELPDATTEIVGHTDNIGKEGYNIKLSERRAQAVYKLLTDAYVNAPAERLHYSGVGPNEPLYDNMTPEARAFNRTVTITLEYMTNN